MGVSAKVRRRGKPGQAHRSGWATRLLHEAGAVRNRTSWMETTRRVRLNYRIFHCCGICRFIGLSQKPLAYKAGAGSHPDHENAWHVPWLVRTRMAVRDGAMGKGTKMGPQSLLKILLPLLQLACVLPLARGHDWWPRISVPIRPDHLPDVPRVRVGPSGEVPVVLEPANIEVGFSWLF